MKIVFGVVTLLNNLLFGRYSLHFGHFQNILSIIVNNINNIIGIRHILILSTKFKTIIIKINNTIINKSKIYFIVLFSLFSLTF